MSETLPRWGLPDVDFLETDATAVETAIIAGYEQASGRSLASGDPVRLFLLSVAAAIIELRGQVNIAARENLLTYAQGGYLDALGVYFGVTRLPPAKALATFRFTLSQALAQAYVIPAGTQVTNGIVTFETLDALSIGAGSLYGDAAAECTVAGSAGNGYAAGQIGTIVAPMPFVASAVNTTESSGGGDEESDAELAARIRLAPNAFSCAGPRKAYVYHARSVSSSILDVGIETQEENDSLDPGVVNVYVLMDGGELPTQDILDAVEEHLSADDIRPLTDEVHVLAPTAVSYSINVDYWIAAEDKARTAEIQAAVTAAVEGYRLWQQSKIGRDIAPERLLHDVIDAGACNVKASTLAPSAAGTVGAGEVAQCAAATVTFLGWKED